MKRQIFLILIFLFAVPLFASSKTETEIQYLSGRGSDDTVDWQFKATDGRRAHEWTTIPVPSNWELQGFGAYNYGHDKPKSDEKGFYRTIFMLPAHWAQKRIFIVFEGSMTDTEVRVNGQLTGPMHRGGFYRFRYEITKLVHFNQKNFLQVLVSKVSADSTVELAERRSDYWVFGGIYRPVYLEAVPQTFIDWTAINARADGSFRAKVFLNGNVPATRVAAQIYTLDGSPLGKPFEIGVKSGEDSVFLTTRVTGQKNWTAETPNLYRAEFQLWRSEKLLHTVRQRFGFRTFEVRKGRGLFLNGQRILLKGCSRHSFWPTTGRALNRNQCRQDILTIKQMNMNAVRMSHYPPDSYFLDLCDELGLYVLDELGGWQRPPYGTAVGEKLLAEMLKRDVNHPSILFWDNGNEGGWNPDLDDDFAKYDLQKRTVLHPGALFNGVDAHHYPSYARLQEELQDSNLVLPTEILHGLYDGGLGAGLDDYWKLLSPHPHFGGMFLWVFADEGVVRTDKNCFIDTDGNHAPDGILGPFHEKEASFYTVREIWSPVFIDTQRPFPSDFNGEIPVENRFNFTNLNQCRFEWETIRFFAPSERSAGHTVLASGSFFGPDVSPHKKGVLHVPLPEDFKNADGLVLRAFAPQNRLLNTWTWKWTPPGKILTRFVREGKKAPVLEKEGEIWKIKTSSFTFLFDAKTGLLGGIRQGTHAIPFSNGPRFVATGVTDSTVSVKIRTRRLPHAVKLFVEGRPHFKKLEWTVDGSGWLQLSYALSDTGQTDYLGISFDYPEKRVHKMTWLGKGPYRVWKNRLKGQTLDVWENGYKNFRPGAAWNYPEFAGYYANVNWVVLNTEDGPLTLAIDSDSLFLRIFSQSDGDHPRHTKMVWPPGDISILHAIPAIGTKFKDADQFGPESQKFQAKGVYSGRLNFYFGLP